MAGASHLAATRQWPGFVADGPRCVRLDRRPVIRALRRREVRSGFVLIPKPRFFPSFVCNFSAFVVSSVLVLFFAQNVRI